MFSPCIKDHYLDPKRVRRPCKPTNVTRAEEVKEEVKHSSGHLRPYHRPKIITDDDGRLCQVLSLHRSTDTDSELSASSGYTVRGGVLCKRGEVDSHRNVLSDPAVRADQRAGFEPAERELAERFIHVVSRKRPKRGSKEPIKLLTDPLAGRLYSLWLYDYNRITKRERKLRAVYLPQPEGAGETPQDEPEVEEDLEGLPYPVELLLPLYPSLGSIWEKVENAENFENIWPPGRGEDSTSSSGPEDEETEIPEETPRATAHVYEGGEARLREKAEKYLDVPQITELYFGLKAVCVKEKAKLEERMMKLLNEGEERYADFTDQERNAKVRKRFENRFGAGEELWELHGRILEAEREVEDLVSQGAREYLKDVSSGPKGKKYLRCAIREARRAGAGAGSAGGSLPYLGRMLAVMRAMADEIKENTFK